MEFAAAMDAILTAVLGLVLVLLVWLHLRLQNMQKSGEKLPQLANKFAKQLLDARRALGEIQTVAADKNLNRNLTEANMAVQELKFMLDRAENTIQRLERAYTKPIAPEGAKSATAGEVQHSMGAVPSAEVIDMPRQATTEQVLKTRVLAPASAAASYGAASGEASSLRRAPVQSAQEQALRRALNERLDG